MGPNRGNLYFGDFRNDKYRTYYEDPDDDGNRNSEASINTLEDKSFGKETEPGEREKVETSKRETNSFMQEEVDVRGYQTYEKEFLVILGNTTKVYSYQLAEEYLLQLLKHNGLGSYIKNYMDLLKDNNLNHNICIIELGESSLQRFLINKEKRVYQFPPSETDHVMVVRDGECGSQLKLNKKQLRKIDFN